MIAVHDPKIYFAKDILSHFAPVSHFTPGYAATIEIYSQVFPSQKIYIVFNPLMPGGSN